MGPFATFLLYDVFESSEISIFLKDAEIGFPHMHLAEQIRLVVTSNGPYNVPVDVQNLAYVLWNRYYVSRNIVLDWI